MLDFGKDKFISGVQGPQVQNQITLDVFTEKITSLGFLENISV